MNRPAHHNGVKQSSATEDSLEIFNKNSHLYVENFYRQSSEEPTGGLKDEYVAPELFLLLMKSLFTFYHCLLSAIIFYGFHVIEGLGKNRFFRFFIDKVGFIDYR